MVPPRHYTANFCRACGDALPSDAAYCPACGTAVTVGQVERFGRFWRVGRTGRGGWESATDTAEGRYQRRIEDYLVEGWTVEREFEDRVVLVDRRFGSLAAHIALVFFTGGVGNLVYAWYCYGPGASRRELRVDGTDRSLSTRKGRVGSVGVRTVAGMLVGFLALSSLVALAALGDVSLLLVALLVTTLVLGGVLVAARRRAGTGSHQSVTTFGRRRTLTERSLVDRTAHCTDCGGIVWDGVERTFADRTYVAGVPVRTHESGTNRYCRACVDGSDRPASVRAEYERERELA